jgi:recombinational DNA repair protein (RecF pathway)
VAGYQIACAHGCPAALAGCQTAILTKRRANMQQQQQHQHQQQQQQPQQSKMFTRRALQAFAGKNKTENRLQLYVSSLGQD